MKKNLFLLWFFFSILSPPGFSQIKLKKEDALSDSLSYLQNFDYFIKNIEKSKFSTNILYDRVIPFAHLHNFNLGNQIDTSNYNHFIQAYYELYLASFNNSGMKTISDIKDATKEKIASSIIPIGILDYSFNFIDSNAFKTGALEKVNKSLNIKNAKVEFIKKDEACVFALLTDKLKPGVYNISLDNNFIFSNNGLQITSLDVFFVNENVSYNFKPGETKSINISQVGKSTISYSLNLINGKKLTGYSQILVSATSTLKAATVTSNTAAISSCGSHRVYGEFYTDYEGVNKQGIADIYFYYSNCNNGQLKKPIIICDGFDPNDETKDIDIYNLMNTDPYHFADNLRANGFDIVIINFPSGADYIVRNAYAYIEAIRWINQQKVTKNKNIAIGPSMGGLITRYALAKMEKDGIDHQTSLWVSFDAPHQGANISIGDQYFLDFFGRVVNNAGAIGGLKKINTPAAKQMLIDHYSTNSDVPSYSWYRTNFMNELKNNGLAGTNGYPKNLRKVALINGSGIGTNQEGIENYSHLLDMSVMKYIGIPCWCYIQVAEAYVTTSSDIPEAGKYVFHGYAADANDIGYYWEKWHYSMPSTSPYFTTSYDKAPGGSYPTQLIMNKDNSDITAHYAGHSYMASVSSLDLKDPYLTLNISTANIIATKRTPFNAYYAPNENQQHVTLHSESVTWLNNEIYSVLPCNTSTIVNTTYTTNTTISNCKISLLNVAVTNQSNVVFDSEGETTITGNFDAILGSSLEIK